MGHPVNSSGPATRRWTWVLTVAALMGIAGWWAMSRPRIELSERGYDVTIALYRICNGRDADGLAKVERLMTEGEGGQSDQEIFEIISLAKSGEWKVAQSMCRQLLEDQVHAD